MKFFILIAIIGTGFLGKAFAEETKKSDDLTCLTYWILQATDNHTGQKPPDKEWLRRVVNVENSFLFRHKLSNDEKGKIIEYYLRVIVKSPKYRSYLESFVQHLCTTEISDSERAWLASELVRAVSNLYLNPQIEFFSPI